MAYPDEGNPHPLKRRSMLLDSTWLLGVMPAIAVRMHRTAAASARGFRAARAF